MAGPDESHKPNRGGLWPVWDFADHVAVGTLIFKLIASAAMALELPGKSYELQRGSP